MANPSHPRSDQAHPITADGVPTCPCPQLFWEFDPAIRQDPPLPIAVTRIAALGSVEDLRWLFRRFGGDPIREWLLRSRAIGLDRKALALICLLSGADPTQVNIASRWIRA